MTNKLRIQRIFSSDSEDLPSSLAISASMPEISREYIKAVAPLPDAERLVTDEHERLYAERALGDLRLINRQETAAHIQIERVRTDIAKVEAALESTPEEIEIADAGEAAAQTTPWDIFIRVKFCFYLVVMIGLLGIGTVTIAGLLINSGYFANFIENPWQAYLLTLLPVALSSAPKFYFDSLDNRKARDRFRRSMIFAAGIAGLAWLIVTALAYAPDSSSDAELIAQILDGEAGGEAMSLAPVTILQILAELLIAALILIHLEELWSLHTPKRTTVTNPRWIELRERRRSLDAEQSEAIARQGDVESDRGSLDDRRIRYLDHAVVFLKQVQQTL